MGSGAGNPSQESGEVRSHYRLANFSRAYGSLRDALEGDVEAMSSLEMEGAIHRFGYTFELGWKLLKDRLEDAGQHPVFIAPRPVVRAAYEARLIKDADAWMSMVVDRNRTSYIYDEDMIDDIIENIQSRYLKAFGNLHDESLQAKHRRRSPEQPGEADR